MKPQPWLVLALGLGACRVSIDLPVGSEDLPSVGAEETSGTAFCSSGGPVSGGGVSGVICLSPLDVTAHQASNGTTTWKPGPVGRIEP